MVFIDNKKYACQQCIKGHRSSSCTHTTRELVEIKAKGRPVTQCEHCRELRKTKQVHVKCLCGTSPSSSTTTTPNVNVNTNSNEEEIEPNLSGGELSRTAIGELYHLPL